jgi:signal-transduction protein with cAMP-binding, CBS, and nucleotidyltransferase domain
MTAISDVMTPNLLPRTASIVDAALAARGFDVEAVIVLDDVQVRGIVTDHDAVVRSIRRPRSMERSAAEQHAREVPCQRISIGTRCKG